MKQVKLLCGLALVALFSVSSHATILVSGFDAPTYSDGALVGQNSWVQVGSTVTHPLTLSGGSLSLVTTAGQAAAHDLGGSAYTDTTIYYGGTINVSSATATGNFILGLAVDTSSATSGGRLFVQSSGTGFILGVSAGTTGVYPTTPIVLSLNQSYRFVVAYTQSTASGSAGNEVIKLYVDPVNVTTESANTVYGTTSGGGVSSIGAIDFVQNTSASPNMTISDFVLATTFAEVAAVPEPSTAACLLTSCLVLVTVVSRRRSAV